LDKITDPNVIGAALAAGCAIYGTDCSSEALGLAQLLSFSGNTSGNQFHGKYFSPKGYIICKAKIDWAHTGIDSQSTFASIIQKDGLGLYAALSAQAGNGTGINSDIYLEFVKSSEASRFGCWPLGVHPWNCRGQGCTAGHGYGFYPGAHYP